MQTNRAPRITIVTPSFNQAQYLEDCIKSVVDQGYPNLQYIIVDGGSTDGSVEIIRQYQDKLSHWISEQDRGHGHALNKGFGLADGEIMGWINSDDVLAPGSLQCIAEIFLDLDSVNWIQGFKATINSRGQYIHCSPNYFNIYDYINGRYSWIQQESTFWRKSIWDKAGGFISETTSLMVDGELWSRFSPSANCITLRA